MSRDCPSCGGKLVAPGGRFCAECGATLIPEQASAQPPGRPPRPETQTRRWPLLAVGGGLAAAIGAATVLLLLTGDTEGIKRPAPRDLPPSVAAIVIHAPEDVETVTRTEFGHALLLAAKQAGLDEAPEPGDDQYEEVRDTAMNAIFEGAWLRGEAAEMRITTTDEEVADELAKLRKGNFPNRSSFRNFIKESGFTREDINDRVRLQILSKKIQNRIKSQQNQQAQQEQFMDFVAKYERKWRWRTVCAPGLATEKCSNGTQPNDDSSTQP